MNKKFYTVYQITDLTNNCIYVGVHATNNLNDNYYGSGNIIRRIIKVSGRKNLKKDILFIFDNKESMLQKEAEIVNENFVSRKDTYNLIIGGTFNTTGLTTVKDKFGNTYKVSVNDKRFLSGELVGITTGHICAKDINGKTYHVKTSDERFLSGELVKITTGTVSVKDKDNKCFRVKNDDERFLSGELIGVGTGLIAVKDTTGNKFSVSKDDERFLSGELVGNNKGIDLNSELKNNILKFRDLGYSYKQIKNELGCALSTINYYCSKFEKTDIGKKSYPISDELKEQIKEYYKAHTLNQTAEQFNVHRNTVKNILKRNFLNKIILNYGVVAPMVEQKTENLCVTSSNLVYTT